MSDTIPQPAPVSPPTPPVILRTATGDLWWIKPLLAIGIMVDFTLQIVVAVWLKDSQLINTMVQTTNNILMVIIGYHFGSSASSDRKTTALIGTQPTAPPSFPPAQ